MSGNAGEKRFFYTGKSMAGTFQEGDELFAVPAEVWHPGDVAIFRTGGKYVIHRVTRVTPDGGLITRGDNNLQDDPGPITAANSPRLVISARSAAGESRPVRRGRRGMLTYRRKQFCRYLLWYLSRLTPSRLKQAPLHWLVNRRNISITAFRDDQVIYYGGRPIAFGKPDGSVVWKSRCWKLFFTADRLAEMVRKYRKNPTSDSNGTMTKNADETGGRRRQS